MYIQPNTTIKLLKDVPLDKSYEHTIYFNSRSTQTSVMSGYAKYTLTNQTYQRVNKGVIRVNYKPEDIYDCNYLMFQNTNFGTKWFYAFIDKIEYVNNVVSEITFTIDVMQTWLNGSGLDYTLKPSFVERQHTTTDVAGDNLVPENLELGDYVMSNKHYIEELEDLKVCSCGNTDGAGDTITTSSGSVHLGNNYGGFPSNLTYFAFDTVQEAGDWMVSWVGSNPSQKVFNLFMFPAELITYNTDITVPRTYRLINNTTPIYKTDTEYKYSSLGSYTPKNKKLLTYPYNFLYISNLQGTSAVYPYEYFSTSNCIFEYTAGVSPNPEVMLYPKNYKGVVSNYDERINLTGYPQLPFNVDNIKTAVNNATLGLAISGLALAGGAIATGGVGALAAGGLATNAGTLTKLGAISAVTNAVKQVTESALSPIQTKGSTSGAVNLVATGELNFFIAQKHIRPEFAAIIDDYFSKFGYAIKRVQVPNIAARPHWTFVKTISCDIEGSLPQDDLSKIREIYDSGITFWKSASEVGNYSLDNTPT